MEQSPDLPARTAAGSVATSGSAPAPGPDPGGLLTSTVHMARAVFAAAACSILLLDEPGKELVFEAVSGEGEDFLVGTHFPADRGLAGWTVLSGEPIAVDDLSESQVFAGDVARSTGYVPTSLMVVPIVAGGDVLGVLEVLDPRTRSAVGIADLDLLMLIADQVGPECRSLIRGRGALGSTAAFADAGYESLQAIVDLLATSNSRQRATVLRLFEALHDTVSTLIRDADGDDR